MGILFPHHLGHYVGLDVHDCPGYLRSNGLKAGQCVTVEPYVSTSACRRVLIVCSGVYVPDDERWPERFRGIGIRIEDSVCVGDEHPIVLTPEAAKEVGDSFPVSTRGNADLTRSMISRPCEDNRTVAYFRYPPLYNIALSETDRLVIRQWWISSRVGGCSKRDVRPRLP